MPGVRHRFRYRRHPAGQAPAPKHDEPHRHGWGLCPEHKRLLKEGYVALVECDPRRSGGAPRSGSMKPEDAYRTGRLAHLKREVFARVFNVPISAEQPCVFVEPGVIDQLQAMVEPTSD